MACRCDYVVILNLWHLSIFVYFGAIECAYRVQVYNKNMLSYFFFQCLPFLSFVIYQMLLTSSLERWGIVARATAIIHGYLSALIFIMCVWSVVLWNH